MSKKQKLELTWIGKEHRPRLEPRILLEEPERSYHAQFRVKVASPAEGLTRSHDGTKQSGTATSKNLRGFVPSCEAEVSDLFDNKLIHGDNLLALKVGLEREIKEMDRLIREARRNAVTAIALEEKLASQKQIKAIESQRNDKRRSLFEAQDAIDKQREDLIGKIEGKLQQSVQRRVIFALRWTLK